MAYCYVAGSGISGNVAMAAAYNIIVASRNIVM